MASGGGAALPPPRGERRSGRVEKPQKKRASLRPQRCPGPGRDPRGPPPGLGEAPAGLGGGARGKQQLGKDIEGLKALIPLCNRGYSAKLIEGKSVRRAVG